MIKEESKDILHMKLIRCVSYKNYRVAIYVNGNTKDIRNFLKGMYGGDVYFDAEAEFYGDGLTFNVVFPNGSSIFVISTDELITDYNSHIIFMDNRIRESFIIESIRPKVDEYRIDSQNAMINPKPIYIYFEEESEK